MKNLEIVLNNDRDHLTGIVGRCPHSALSRGVRHVTTYVVRVRGGLFRMSKQQKEALSHVLNSLSIQKQMTKSHLLK